MRRIPFLLITLCLFANCKLRKNATDEKVHLPTYIHFSLTAENLSEDAFKMSSHDDEIIALAYFIPQDTAQSTQLILSESCDFDSLLQVHQFNSTAIDPSAKGEYCFLLIEVDGDKTKVQIELAVRQNLSKIKAAFSANDMKALTPVFIDDDLLGIKSFTMENFNSQPENVFIIEGLHLFDAYKYRLVVKRVN